MNFCELIAALTFSFVGLLCPVPADTVSEDPAVPPVVEHRFDEPVPVQIIDPAFDADVEASKAEQHERRAIEAIAREEAALAAQQGMNAATKSMNIATQRMANYSLYSTWLVGIGTLLLLITLGLTWQANRAAQKAVKVTREIGQKQVRAYLSVSILSLIFSEDKQSILFRIRLRNLGQSPASGIKMKLRLQVVCTQANKQTKLDNTQEFGLTDSCGSDDRELTVEFSRLDINELHAAEKISCFAQLITQYKDVFDDAQMDHSGGSAWIGSPVELSEIMSMRDVTDGMPREAANPVAQN